MGVCGVSTLPILLCVSQQGFICFGIWVGKGCSGVGPCLITCSHALETVWVAHLWGSLKSEFCYSQLAAELRASVLVRLLKPSQHFPFFRLMVTGPWGRMDCCLVEPSSGSQALSSGCESWWWTVEPVELELWLQQASDGNSSAPCPRLQWRS